MALEPIIERPVYVRTVAGVAFYLQSAAYSLPLVFLSSTLESLDCFKQKIAAVPSKVSLELRTTSGYVSAGCTRFHQALYFIVQLKSW